MYTICQKSIDRKVISAFYVSRGALGRKTYILLDKLLSCLLPGNRLKKSASWQTITEVSSKLHCRCLKEHFERRKILRNNLFLCEKINFLILSDIHQKVYAICQKESIDRKVISAFYVSRGALGRKTYILLDKLLSCLLPGNRLKKIRILANNYRRFLKTAFYVSGGALRAKKSFEEDFFPGRNTFF